MLKLEKVSYNAVNYIDEMGNKTPLTVKFDGQHSEAEKAEFKDANGNWTDLEMKFKYAYCVIAGLPGSNGQKNYGLKRLEYGINEVTNCKAQGTNGRTMSKVKYTPEEQAELAQLEARIAEIKAAAKARAPQPAKKLEDMNAEELAAKIAEMQSLLKGKSE